MSTQDDTRTAALERAIRLKRARAGAPAAELPRKPPEAAAFLGELQQGLWLVHQIDPESAAYNLASAYRFRGRVDREALERAFNEVVARHRILRAVFLPTPEGVQQVIRPHENLALEVVEAEAGRVREIATDAARRPFALDSGPLVRLLVVREARSEEGLLVLILHHILADERSLAILWGELAAAYEGDLSAEPPAVQYDDYLYWLGQREPSERKQALDLWRQRLEPFPGDLNLPFETREGDGGIPRGRLLTRSLSGEVGAALRGLASQVSSTPFSVAAFAFRQLLDRYTGGRRVAFATPVSTRLHPGAAEMVGYFTNAVVIPTVIDEHRTLETALRDFTDDLREHVSGPSVPFHVLAEKLAPPRRAGRHPIFQAMFVYQERAAPLRIGTLQLEPVSLDLGAAKFDLSLFVGEGRESLELAVEYRADRFEAAWIERLLDHYATLLQELPKKTGRPAAEVSMLGAAERSKLCEFSTGEELKRPDSRLVPQQILDQTQRHEHAPAVAFGEEAWSYQTLRKSAMAVGEALRQHGLVPGAHVAVHLDRSPYMVAAVLGCHWAGAAYVPLDPAYPEARNRFLLEDADVAAVLSRSSLRSQLPDGVWVTIEVDRLPGATEDGAGAVGLSPNSAAYILYTSGSTGRPKGVCVSQANLRASNGARLQAYDFLPRRFLLVPSMAFDSSVAGLFWTLAAAGTLVIPSDDDARDPRRLARLVIERQVTSLLCVPSLYTQLLRAGGEKLGCLEAAIVAGESCPPSLVAEHFRILPQVRLFNEYGPTEATVWATLHEMSEADAGNAVAIGRPIPGVTIDIVDALGRAVPAGVPGEAVISGPTVAAGYWKRPELTEDRFDSSGRSASAMRRYRTGDRMAWSVDGNLFFLGRADEQIKLRGFRIAPAEVESALLELPGVEKAAVVARTLADGSTASARSPAEQLVAFVELHDSDALDGWRERLGDCLPAHLIPAHLMILDRLPLLPNGKVDRKGLQEIPLEIKTDGRGERPGAVSNLEQVLISLWEGLLGHTGVGVNDNFFELGGHSLLVVEMILAIEADLGVDLAVADVFANPTVGGLARRIEGRDGAALQTFEHLFPIQPFGPGRPLIFAIPHFFTETFAERFRGERPVYGLRGIGLRPEGNLGRWRSMGALGEDMVEEILRRFPDEKFILAGYSFGATMAVEVARQMEERGVSVDRLYLIAPMPLDVLRIGPLRFQLDHLHEPVEELGRIEKLRRIASSNNPFTLRLYRRLWRWAAIEPWRRLLCNVGRLRKLIGLPLGERILYADVRVDRFRLHARYRPQPISAPTEVFNAIEPETNAAATWRPYFSGPFTVHETPDPHLGEARLDDACRVILRHLEDLEDA